VKFNATPCQKKTDRSKPAKSLLINLVTNRP
jgi:hypothetical protein